MAGLHSIIQSTTCDGLQAIIEWSNNGLQSIVQSTVCDGLQSIIQSTVCDGLQSIIQSMACDGLQLIIQSTACDGLQSIIQSTACDVLQSIIQSTACDELQSIVQPPIIVVFSTVNKTVNGVWWTTVKYYSQQHVLIQSAACDGLQSTACGGQQSIIQSVMTWSPVNNTFKWYVMDYSQYYSQIMYYSQ